MTEGRTGEGGRDEQQIREGRWRDGRKGTWEGWVTEDRTWDRNASQKRLRKGGKQ